MHADGLHQHGCGEFLLLCCSTCCSDRLRPSEIPFKEVIVRPNTETDMAQRRAELESDRETFFCPLCLNLLEEPVATPCGHNYCRKCLQAFWDEEQEYSIYSCPRCMKTFASRPLPTANTELAAVVEQLKKSGTSADKADGGCCAGQGDLTEATPGNVSEVGPEDVACDVCTGRKRKALQSCMDCLASYCELHLQPHQDVTLLKKHQLVNPSKRQRLKTCPRHEDEDLDMFCRTDQCSICHLCSAEEHSDHDVVSAAEERAKKQKELEGSRESIQQEVKEQEKLLEMLPQEMDSVRQSAEKTVHEGEEVFSKLMALLETKREEMRQEIWSRQEKEVNRIKDFREKLQRDIAELKKRDAILRWISDTTNDRQFLDHFSALPSLSKDADSARVQVRTAQHFSAMTEVLPVFQEKIEEALDQGCLDLKWTVLDADMLLSEPQPKARDDFLKYSCDITLDRYSAYRRLTITNGCKSADRIQDISYRSFSEEHFRDFCQVLSCQQMTGKCYWEVEWKMDTNPISVAVAYGNIKRGGCESKFGANAKSWALYCCNNEHVEFHHNGTKTILSSCPPSRIGVYLDYNAGLLSFYDVYDSMTRLYRVQTTFTSPLYAGFYVGDKSCVTLK